MKTYIINLERSGERRKHILQEAERCNLEYELIKAVDGNKLSDSDYEKFCDMDEVRKYPGWLNSGAIGCSLSHYNVYKKIIEDNVEMALVLEDDIILRDDLSEMLVRIKENIRSNEIISLFYASFAPCQLSNQNVVSLSADYDLHFPMDVNQPMMAAAYVITKEAARTLSDVILPIRGAADSWGYYYENKGFESFRCVYPVPLKVMGAKSDINYQSRHKFFTKIINDYKIPVFYQALRIARLRKIKAWSEIQLVDKASPVAEIVR